MAHQKNLPGFHEKRKPRFSPKTLPAKMRETAQTFMDAERYDDALDLLAACDAPDMVRRIAARALEDGNVPLYMRARKVLGETITDAEWTKLAATAERAGRLSMAHVAHLKAGHEEEAARLREAMDRQAPAYPSTGAEPPAAPPGQEAEASS